MVVGTAVVEFVTLVMVGLEELVVGGTVLDEAVVVVVTGLPHSPSREGTASGPLPMATSLEPQSSLLARWMLRLSQS